MDTTTSYLGFRLAHPFIAAPALTGGETADMMKALVYLGPGRRAWQSKPRPVIRDPADAVVRITTSTIGDPDAAEASSRESCSRRSWSPTGSRSATL